MIQYINKDDVIAKIDNILDYADEHWDTDYIIGAKMFVDKLQDAINTINMKEVDLERAIDKWICDAAITHEDCSVTDVISTAKHFFELGLKA